MIFFLDFPNINHPDPSSDKGVLYDFWKTFGSQVGPFVRPPLVRSFEDVLPQQGSETLGDGRPFPKLSLHGFCSIDPSKSPNITLNGKRQQKAIELDPVEIVDFPIEHGGSFHSYVTVYQILINVGLLGDSSIMRCV